METYRNKCFDMAKERVNNKSINDYGEPENTFALIAKFWETYLDCKINEEDVANMMILLKIARNTQQTKDDNYIDIAGYASCGYDLMRSKKLANDGKTTTHSSGNYEVML